MPKSTFLQKNEIAVTTKTAEIAEIAEKFKFGHIDENADKTAFAKIADFTVIDEFAEPAE